MNSGIKTCILDKALRLIDTGFVNVILHAVLTGG
jgi:hypothetical protein